MSALLPCRIALVDAGMTKLLIVIINHSLMKVVYSNSDFVDLRSIEAIQ